MKIMGKHQQKKRRTIASSPAFRILSAAAAVFLVLTAAFAGHFLRGSGDVTPTPAATLAPSPSPSPSPTPEPDLSANAVLLATGDIILHDSVIKGGRDSEGQYHFDYLFEYVKDLFTGADLTAANFEGTMNGPEYSGYPAFNAPDAIAEAIRNAGIRLVTTANNHAYDSGLAGLRRTASVFAEYGVAVVGTRSRPDDPPYVILDLNGIRVGFTGYTYETAGTETRRALNGMVIAEEAEPLVDSFNSYRAARFEKDKQGMAERLAQMKRDGAECIVLILHWGDEYQSSSSKTQKDLAQFLSDSGADIIIGHHPHVLQEIGVVESQVSGKKTLVYYSLGNILANMGFNTHQTSGRAEDAVIARIGLSRDRDGNVTVRSGEYIKTYIYKKDISGRRIHRIMPVAAAIADPEAFGLDAAGLALVKASDKRISDVLGGSGGDFSGIHVGEYGSGGEP